jgi:hypothetical protein
MLRHIRSAWPSSVGGETVVGRGAFLDRVGMWGVAGLALAALVLPTSWATPYSSVGVNDTPHQIYYPQRTVAERITGEYRQVQLDFAYEEGKRAHKPFSALAIPPRGRGFVSVPARTKFGTSYVRSANMGPLAVRLVEARGQMAEMSLANHVRPIRNEDQVAPAKMVAWEEKPSFDAMPSRIRSSAKLFLETKTSDEINRAMRMFIDAIGLNVNKVWFYEDKKLEYDQNYSRRIDLLNQLNLRYPKTDGAIYSDIQRYDNLYWECDQYNYADVRNCMISDTLIPRRQYVDDCGALVVAAILSEVPQQTSGYGHRHPCRKFVSRLLAERDLTQIGPSAVIIRGMMGEGQAKRLRYPAYAFLRMSCVSVARGEAKALLHEASMCRLFLKFD